MSSRSFSADLQCGGLSSLFFFFFQAEDGIRDYKVTGVQTCALPISNVWGSTARNATHDPPRIAHMRNRKRVSPYARGTYSSWVATSGSARRDTRNKIGRASCRERV